MKLANDCIANNLSVLSDLSFSSVVFLDKLKIAKRAKTRMLKLQTNFVALKS